MRGALTPDFFPLVLNCKEIFLQTHNTACFTGCDWLLQDVLVYKWCSCQGQHSSLAIRVECAGSSNMKGERVFFFIFKFNFIRWFYSILKNEKSKDLKDLTSSSSSFHHYLKFLQEK